MNVHEPFCRKAEVPIEEDWTRHEVEPGHLVIWRDAGQIKHSCVSTERMVNIGKARATKAEEDEVKYINLLAELGYTSPEDAPTDLQILAREFVKDPSPGKSQVFLRQAGLAKKETTAPERKNIIMLRKDSVEAVNTLLDRLGPPPPVDCPHCGQRVWDPPD